MHVRPLFRSRCACRRQPALLQHLSRPGRSRTVRVPHDRARVQLRAAPRGGFRPHQDELEPDPAQDPPGACMRWLAAPWEIAGLERPARFAAACGAASTLTLSAGCLSRDGSCPRQSATPAPCLTLTCRYLIGVIHGWVWPSAGCRRAAARLAWSLEGMCLPGRPRPADEAESSG